ncbi:YbgC/FadM family acyl-CoA thioesterase [Sphingomonas solaris]|uniref:YbgC/FadM family acyl-CoA thioesterase n=1 Tax=Alterirhizorhabdus solaris TaxID=2529389 RepID=A0A558QYS7_9SPHN|nr:YbgC/FadM family acyl-CoA thioesterase [Sphingomonas solaris]TVV72303.1 YbgC/FadM family acyl-CoA thioesterase [Sphingomonas solaris]
MSDANATTLPTLDQPYAGGFVDGVHRFALRVYFEDTDLTGIVYHAGYLRFMERARSDMLRAAGIDQRAAHEAGEGAYAVADLAIRYRRPAKLDDALVVVSTVTAIRAASCAIHQRVMRGGEVLTQADVTAAFVSPDGRPRRQPPAWVAIFEQIRGKQTDR